MTTQIRFLLAAVILTVSSLMSPTLARGQQLAPRAGLRPAAPAHARPVGTRVVVSRATSNQRVVATGRVLKSNASANALNFGGASPFSLQDLSVQDLLNPVPGLGFDYAHLAAINRDLGIKAVIDPATQWRLAVAERLLRDTRGSTPNAGFFWLDGGGEYIVPTEPAPAEQPQQPPIIILQQAPAPQPSNAQSVPTTAAPEVASPLPDIGQFTLVLQDGTRIQAVAFTCLDDRIVYITADGSRRTIAASDLDSRTTKRINEERGTPLRLPL